MRHRSDEFDGNREAAIRFGYAEIAPPAAPWAPPEAVVSVSFDGPPDGSEDHHRGRSNAALVPSTRFPAVQCGGWRRAVPGSLRASASARDPLRSVRPTRQRFPSGLRARRRATTGAVTVRRAVARSRHPELPLRAAAVPAVVRGAHADRSATAQVHRSGASPGRA